MSALYWMASTTTSASSRLAKVESTTAGFVQQSIHSSKCLSRVETVRRESSVGRQTVVEAPREENGLFRLIDVRKPPAVERHTRMVRQERRNSHPKKRPAGGVGRGRGGPPHQAVN